MTDYQAKTPTLLALVSFREFFREGAKPNTFVTLSVYPKKPDHGGDHHITVITRSNRLDLVVQFAEHWTSKPKVAGSIPTVVRQIFQLARCGYTLRITPQTHSTPEYITS